MGQATCIMLYVYLYLQRMKLKLISSEKLELGNSY